MSKSPFKIPAPLVAMGISAGVSAIGGLIGASQARRAERRAQLKEDAARKEMNRLKDIYSNLDTSNPYLGMSNVYSNMENTMEDLTVNQQQALFERQQFQQSQANILSSLRGAAGGSGIGSLAQSLAQQGQLRAQQASASIGAQESANQRLRTREASRIQALQLGERSRLQNLERQGEIYSRGLERQRTETLLGMSQADVAGSVASVGAARQARYNAISGAFGGMSGALTAGISGGAFGGGSTPTAYLDENEMDKLNS